MNHLDSVDGDDNRPDIDSTFVQPFLSHTRGPLTVTANFEGTYDHETEQWNLPLNIVATKVSRLGGQLVNWGGGVKVYTDAPDGAPSWGLRVNVVLMYPNVRSCAAGTLAPDYRNDKPNPKATPDSSTSYTMSPPS